jgi:flagellar biosynthesis chaperone FliJ
LDLTAGDVMGKQNKEMNAFNTAKKIRETLIEQLKRCNSEEDLARFLRKYNKNKQNRDSSISLTVHHQEQISAMDVEIEELIRDLNKRFSPEVPLEISPSVEQHIVVPSIVEEDAILTTTPVFPLEPTKENHPLQQVDEHHKVDVPIEEGKGRALTSTVIKAPLESLTKSDELVREESGELTQPQIKRTVTFAPLEGRQVPIKALADDKLPQGTQVDPRIRTQRHVHIFDVNVKLRAIETKQRIYEGKVEEYRKEKKRKEVLKYQRAANAAKSIYIQIKELTNQYILDGDLVSFKSKSQDVLGDDKDNVKTLRTHRGWWEKFLDDLVDLINTGLDRVGSSVRMHKLSLFKPLADGGKKVTELNNVIISLKAI